MPDASKNQVEMQTQSSSPLDFYGKISIINSGHLFVVFVDATNMQLMPGNFYTFAMFQRFEQDNPAESTMYRVGGLTACSGAPPSNIR